MQPTILPNVLITVAKRPAPGKTKTRLTPPLSPAKAAGLYECFLKDTIEMMRNVPGVQPVLAYLPQGQADYFHGLAPDFKLALQSGDDLGARLDNATSHYLALGYKRVAIMNSDSPNLPVEYLSQAFDALARDSDIVIGPCNDGGYYLIGLKKPAPRLLREVQMSTSHVTAETLKLAKEEGLKAHLLPMWYDVDNAASLARLQNDLAQDSNTIARHTRRFLGRLQPSRLRAD
ncbi:TIGR04282 family arsenosugar biosynthesis glycosyltransferase [Chloroflexota bacterium]